jgi:hypothetical protein
MPTLIAGVVAIIVLYLLFRVSAIRRIVGGVVAVVVAFFFYNFVVAPYYGVDTAIYECSGVMTTKIPTDKSGPITLFAKITQNRWWMVAEPLDGWLRLEIQSTTGPFIPTTPDKPSEASLFKTSANAIMVARFPGLGFGPKPFAIREDLFAIKRGDDYLLLYPWPKAEEATDLTGPGQGGFSTLSNSLHFKLSSDATFNGNCKPKK